MDEAHAVLVDRNQKHFRVVRFGCLLHLEKCGAERRPTINDLQESHFRILGTHAAVLIVGGNDRTLPVVGALQLNQIGWNEFSQHLPKKKEFCILKFNEIRLK